MSERDEDGDEFAEGIEIEQAPEAADETLTGDVVEDGEPEAEEPEKAEDEGSEDEPEKGKRRSKPASERIAEITRDKHEAIRRAEAAEARLAQLQNGQPEAAATPELAEPNPEEFEFGEADPQYLKALAKYEVRVELSEARKAEAVQAQVEASKARAAELDTSWAEQAEKAVERYPDFAEKVEDYKSEPCPLLMAAAIQSSEFAADVVYHLANNPKENRELAHLAETDPMEAARRFGRLEARFEAKAANDTKPQGNRVTSAPEPASERTRGAGGRFTPDYASENVDLDDVMKALKTR